MRKHLTKKRVILLAVVALAIGLGTGAYAFFTTSGSGTGSASVGSASTIQLSSDAVGPLYPGAASTPVTVHVHNPGGGTQHVGTISGAVADNGGCLGSWFTVGSVTYNQDVAGGGDGPDATSSITLNDSGTNQDACQGASVTINWSST
jgi:hypothetical protein